MTTPPLLSVIIVSWNVRDLLRACLRSLAAQTPPFPLETIVVDSGSQDGTVEMVRAEFPAVRLVARPDNVGFALGNNLGLALAQGEFLLLLNPDTELRPHALEQMIAYLQAHPEVGLLGPELLYPDGSHQSSRRRFPTLLTALFESTWFQPYAPRRLLTHYYALDLPHDTTHEVDWVVGACLCTRRAVVAQVGGLDEGYFMYSEELDWQRRIQTAGWRIVYHPAAQVVHHVGKSSEQATTARHIRFHRAKLRYFRRHHGPTAYAILRLWLLFNFVWQLGVEGAKWVLGNRRELRAQRLRAYWAVLQTGLPAANEEPSR